MRKRTQKAENSFQQCTLAHFSGIHGVGLHSGKQVEMTIGPARAGSGIVFERLDLPGRPQVSAKPQHVTDSPLCTTLEECGVRVSTVEHLLAAFFCLGVDNAHVAMDGEEVPILDGSAGPFVQLIREVGLRTLGVGRTIWSVTKPMTISEGDRSIRVFPARRFSIECTLDFDHPLICNQRFTYRQDPDAFEHAVAPSRTFGLLRDVETIRQAGLARGGSLDNVVVVDDFSILNPEGLRFPDEFVRHKVLDILGDLSLMGGSLLAKVVAVKSGHRLHHSLVHRMISKDAPCSRIQIDPLDFPRDDLSFDLTPFRMQELLKA
jgi:UDP-3-O-[3-hydroxymyristoyl] N-acetylglucosamine deacetylase